MYNLLPLISLSALTGAAIIQHQQPLIQHAGDHAEAPLINSPEELVSSTSLEARITKEALQKRAEHLYKIAEEGIPEYNHPTRVIGSKGRAQLLACFR
jgi:aminopeptidase Y